jgi:DNA-binding NarL/FixJ family response regulator
VRVAIAEDSVLLREGVVRLLADGGIDVTASCGTAAELLVRVAENPPDAVVVDIRLPPTHTDEGMQAALTIRQKYPDVGVLVLSQYVEVGLAMRLLARLKESAIC